MRARQRKLSNVLYRRYKSHEIQNLRFDYIFYLSLGNIYSLQPAYDALPPHTSRTRCKSSFSLCKRDKTNGARLVFSVFYTFVVNIPHLLDTYSITSILFRPSTPKFKKSVFNEILHLLNILEDAEAVFSHFFFHP